MLVLKVAIESFLPTVEVLLLFALWDVELDQAQEIRQAIAMLRRDKDGLDGQASLLIRCCSDLGELTIEVGHDVPFEPIFCLIRQVNDRRNRS